MKHIDKVARQTSESVAWLSKKKHLKIVNKKKTKLNK